MKIKLAALALIVTVAGTLIWQWRSAVDDAATARQKVTELRQALESTEAEASQARDRIDALSAAVEAQRDRAQQAQQQRNEAEQRLRKLEANNEQVRNWSDAPIPDDVRDWLRGSEPAGRAD